MKKMWLVVGLGNPEGKYFNTYHNVGFACADLLASQVGTEFKKKGNQLICDFKTSGGQGGNQTATKSSDTKVFVLKPLTYMNLSGQAVVAVMRKYKIAPENVIVFTDDLYIEKGNIRIAFGGSNAGHNGIKSINELVATNQYIKIKVGIKPEKPPHNVSDYVLRKIDAESKTAIDESIIKAVSAAAMLLDGETLAKVQGTYNTRQDA